MFQCQTLLCLQLNTIASFQLQSLLIFQFQTLLPLIFELNPAKVNPPSLKNCRYIVDHIQCMVAYAYAGWIGLVKSTGISVELHSHAIYYVGSCETDCPGGSMTTWEIIS